MTAASQAIREEVLRDPRHPVHKIADRLLPYLRVLVEQFDPEQVILFGSHAYGNPDEHSDVDLLVIKKLRESPIAEATAIRRAFRPLRRSGYNIPLDIMVRDSEDLQERLALGAAFHTEVIQKGLRLV